MSTLREAIEAKVHETKALLESAEEEQKAKGVAALGELYGVMAAAARGLSEIEEEGVIDSDACEDLVNMAEALESYQAELEDAEDDEGEDGE